MSAKGQSGAISIFTFVVMITLTAITVAFLYMISIRIKSSGLELASAQAFWLAEAGRAQARWALNSASQSVGWATSDVPLGGGTYSVTSFYSGSNCTIISDGYIPNDLNPVARSRVVESNISFGATSTNNLSLSATASASSTNGRFSAPNAIDNNINTKWKSGVNGVSWLKLDFAGLTTFNKVVIVGGVQIITYTLEYSTNNITFYPVSNLIESPAWTFTFNAVSARYLRFNTTGNRSEVSEFQTYNSGSATGSVAGLGQGIFSTLW